MFQKLLFYFSMLIVINMLNYNTKAQDSKVNDIFEGYSSEYVGGYLKPVFTSIHQGINSNFFTNNNYKKGEWRFGLDISGNAMMIPESQKTFTTSTPSEWSNSKISYLDGEGNTVYKNEKSITQPTLYGSSSTPLFSTDTLGNNSLVKTYLEGFNISNISALPNLQFVIGLPSQTEVRLRGFGGEGAMYYGIIVNQRVDELFDIFGINSKKHSLGVNVGYQGASFEYNDKNSTRDIDLNFDMSTIAFGLNYGYNIANNFNVYSGLQFETLSGNLDAKYIDNTNINTKSENVINADVESFNSFRALVGLSYKLSFAEFHVDGIYASQPMLTAGITFHFGSWGLEDEAASETKTEEPKLEETKTE